MLCIYSVTIQFFLLFNILIKHFYCTNKQQTANKSTEQNQTQANSINVLGECWHSKKSDTSSARWMMGSSI